MQLVAPVRPNPDHAAETSNVTVRAIGYAQTVETLCVGVGNALKESFPYEMRRCCVVVIDWAGQ
jgi:hypothetical protein